MNINTLKESESVQSLGYLYDFFVILINYLKETTLYSMNILNNIIDNFGLTNYKGIVYIVIFFTLYKILSVAFMQKNKYFLILFELPGTLIHEISHALVAVITGSKILKFSIMPVFEKDRIILGQVIHASKNNYFLPFISTAPLYLNMVILINILNLFIKNPSNFNLFNNGFSLFLSYLCVVILSSSILSIQDISNFIKSMFNIVFLSIIIFILIAIKSSNINFLTSINNILNSYIYIFHNSILFLIFISLILIIFNLILNFLLKK